MISKGRIGDIGLTTLFQILSAENATAVLNLWQSEKGEGVVLFEHGRMSLARTKDAQGQAAVYELSHWDDATFRLTPRAHAGASVDSAEALAIHNGYRQHNVDPGLRWQLFGPDNNAASVQEDDLDQLLETELITLLSRLDSGKQALARWRNQRRPHVALEILARMLNDAVYSAESVFEEGSFTLTRARAMAGHLYPVTLNLPISDNQIAEQSLVTLYKGFGSLERVTLVPQLIAGVLEIFETFFFDMVFQFHRRELAEQWQETASLFLSELEATLQKVKFQGVVWQT